MLSLIDPAPRNSAPKIRRPRVLQVISSMAVVHGGPSTALWTILDALKRRGIESDLVTTNEDGPKRLMDVPTDAVFEVRGHRVRYFRTWRDRYTTSWPLARWLSRHVSDYDVVHIHGLFRFAPDVGAHIAHLRGVPYVLTPHNTLGRWIRTNRRPLLKKISIGLIQGRILEHASRVHLTSSAELEQSCDVAPLQAKSVVFPLGMELDAVTVDSVAARSRMQELNDLVRGQRVLLYMGRVDIIKGLDLLLEAFAAVREFLPRVTLLIAGDGDPKLTLDLKKLAGALGIGDSVHWLGFVTGSFKNHLWSVADAYVLPSRSENFGLTVIEALLAGVPVITSCNVPAGKYATRDGAGLVFDGTVEGLEECLCSMFNGGERFKPRALGAQVNLRDELSLERFGERLEALYDSACRGHTSNRQASLAAQ